MRIFLVNQDNPAALSLAKKLTNIPEGCSLVKLTKEEMKAYGSMDLIEQRPIIAIDNSNPNLQVVPLDLHSPNPLTYLIVAKLGFVRGTQMERLKQQLGDRCIIATTS